MSDWIQSIRRRPDCRMRLFCFPFAGGAAQAFRAWHDALDERIDVCPIQLPGRWQRIREPCLRSVDAIVDAAESGIGQELDKPFALYGHSLGGLVAFELARRLAARGQPPVHLIVAARKAPQIPHTLPPVHEWSDDEFLDWMTDRYQAVPPQVRETPDLLELVLPALRADMEAFVNYRYVERDPLTVPITVLGGTRDRTSTRDELERWAEQTTADFAIEMVEGPHLFLLDQPETVVSVIQRRLEPWLATR